MNVREKLKESKVGVTVAVVLILVAVAITAVYLHSRPATIDSFSTFFSDDDGQSYFRDSIYKIPPFDHNGKTANLAIVCTDGKQNFVAFLCRYTPSARQKLQSVYDANPDAHFKVIDMMASPQIGIGGMEVKLPGATNKWLPRSMGLPPVRGPDGSGPEDVTIVRP